MGRIWVSLLSWAVIASAATLPHYPHADGHLNPLDARAIVKKRGLAFNSPNYTQPFGQDATSQVSWAYDWASSPYYDVPESIGGVYNSRLRFIPMLWNNHQDLTSIWNANVKAAITQYKADAVLGFNEPDACQGGSACMSVPLSAHAYKLYITPFKGKVLLGSPAVTNAAAPGGLAWLKHFMKACSTCKIDFIALHWYGSVLQPEALESYLQQAHAMFPGYPIWLTEFGTTSGTPQQVKKFLKTALPWLDARPWIHRYAYYMDRPGNTLLLRPSGAAKNPIGVLYDS